jgi:putative intracellular protease/amidase
VAAKSASDSKILHISPELLQDDILFFTSFFIPLTFKISKMPLEHRILALVFHDFEALDLFGPLGAIVPRSDYYTLDLVNVHNLPAPQGLESTIKNGIGIVPTMSITDALQDIEPFDTLFIPGGLGMIALLDDPMLLKKIGELVDRARTVFTVCTGSLVLAATGRLNGREATCNKRIYDEMTPKCRYYKVTYHDTGKY